MDVVYPFLWAFLIFLGTSIIISTMTRWRMRQNRTECLVEPVVAFILNATFLIASLVVLPMTDILVRVEILFFLTLALVYSHVRLRGMAQLSVEFIICLAAVLVYPTSLPLFEQLPAAISYPILALSLLAIVKLTVFSDKTPWMMMLILLGQVMFVTLLVIGKTPYLPMYIVELLGVMAIVTASAILTVRTWIGKPVLGEYGALSVGFLMGTFEIGFIAFGKPLAPLIVWSVPVFLWAVSVFSTLAMTHRLYPIVVPSLLEQALDKNIKEKRLLYLVLFTEVMLSILAIISISSEDSSFSTLLFGEIIFLSFLFVRLRHWGEPKPTLRGVFRDVKMGGSVLFQELKKNPLKLKNQEKAVHIKDDNKSLSQGKVSSVTKKTQKKRKK